MSPASPTSRSDRAYLFIGGPFDGRRVKTGGVRVFRVPELDSLEGQLRASLLLESGGTFEMPPGAAAEMSFRVAQYELRRLKVLDEPNIIPLDREAYQFMGYET